MELHQIDLEIQSTIQLNLKMKVTFNKNWIKAESSSSEFIMMVILMTMILMMLIVVLAMLITVTQSKIT